MKIRSILLILTLLVGVATTATTWARCPCGCGRFSSQYFIIPQDSVISSISGTIISITTHRILVNSDIGIVSIYGYNSLLPFIPIQIGRHIVLATRTIISANGYKKIVIIGIIKNSKKIFLNRPVYCQINNYYRGRGMKDNFMNRKRGRIRRHWFIW